VDTGKGKKQSRWGINSINEDTGTDNGKQIAYLEEAWQCGFTKPYHRSEVMNSEI
jgi:hypothetical protein